MGTFAAIRDAFRPYGMHALLLVYTPALLFVDGAHGRAADRNSRSARSRSSCSPACVRRLGPAERWQVWICVPVATLFEVFGSLIWGGYHYQLHNIPLYVPPGHALVFVFGITAGSLPLVRRHRHGRLPHVVLGLATRLDGGRAHRAAADRAPARPARRGVVAAPRLVHPAVEPADDVRRDLGRDGHPRDRRDARRRLDLGRRCPVEPSRGRQPPVGDRGRVRRHRRLRRARGRAGRRRMAEPTALERPLRRAPAAPDAHLPEPSGTVRPHAGARDRLPGGDPQRERLRRRDRDAAAGGAAALGAARQPALPQARGPAAGLLVQAARRLQQDVAPLGRRAAARGRRRVGRQPRAGRRARGAAPRQPRRRS